MRKLFLLLFSLLLLTSCAGYVNSVYSQLDREEAQVNKRTSGKDDKFAFYRKKGKSSSNQVGTRLNTTERKVVDPSIKRQYVPSTEAKKRYTAEDLQDNSQSGSLWAGEGKDNSLFASKHEKQNGDIVVINVMANLKNEITAELKKAFPSEVPAPKLAATTPAPLGDKTAPAEKAPAAPADDTATEQGRVYDRISSVIIEEINRDHILLRGRKTLMYNNRKVTVEVQALAPRKSLTEDDSIDSDTILESNIRVVR